MALFKVYDSRRFAQVYSSRGADTTDTADTIPGNAIYGFTANATLTLRDATINAGALVTVKNQGSHTGNVVVSIVGHGGQAIEGVTTYQIASRQSVTLFSDGANWRIAAHPAQLRQIVSRTTAYSMLKEDVLNANTILCTSGTFTVTLPSAGSNPAGVEATIKNAGAGVITLATTSSQTIDGSTTRTLNANQGVTVKSTGSAWVVVAAV